jgi:hypothetical protein
MLRFTGLVSAAAALASLGFAHAQPTDDSLRIYAVDIWQEPPQSWGPGRGVYLGKSSSHRRPRCGFSRPHQAARAHRWHGAARDRHQGGQCRASGFDASVDEQKLPVYLRMRRMPLCDNKPWPGEPVIVAIPEGTARSHIMLPSLLPAKYQKRFSTVIRDVATTGNSGSGVFDAGQKCLLGIISLKICQTPSSEAPESEHKDIAKYFVPASTIRAFIPTEYRF